MREDEAVLKANERKFGGIQASSFSVLDTADMAQDRALSNRVAE